VQAVSVLIPFFYYDIVARLIPGGVTLMVIAFGFSERPFWKSTFLSATEHWNSLLAALVLGGLAYAIGVLFEGWFAFVKLRGPLENKAWLVASREFGLPETVSPKSRTWLWEKLVLAAAQDPSSTKQPVPSQEASGQSQLAVKSAFAHCHRFQAEYKMCQHLIVPTLLFLAFTWFRHSHWFWFLIGVSFLVLLPVASYSRDKRRWWQLLVFGEQLGWIPEGLAQEKERAEKAQSQPGPVHFPKQVQPGR